MFFTVKLDYWSLLCWCKGWKCEVLLWIGNMLKHVCGIKLVRKNVVIIASLSLVLSVLISFYYQNIVLEKVRFFRYNLYTRSFVVGNKTFTETQCNCRIVNTTLVTQSKLPICNQEALSSKTGRPTKFESLVVVCFHWYFSKGLWCEFLIQKQYFLTHRLLFFLFFTV